MNEIIVRPSEIGDIHAIERIYTHEVLTGTSTYEKTPPSTDELLIRRKDLLAKGYPYLVACIDDNVVGYAYAGPYRARSAYQHTVENSVYIDKDAHNMGVGRTLLQELINSCEKGPWRQMIAVIGDKNNTGSIALHTKLGFRTAGELEGIGFKFERWLDSVIMQRALNGKDTA